MYIYICQFIRKHSSAHKYLVSKLREFNQISKTGVFCV